MAAENPLIAKVLQRYDGVSRESLNFPADSLTWTENEVDLFVGSGGFLKPKRRGSASGKPVAAAPVAKTEAAPVPAPAQAPAAAEAEEASSLQSSPTPAASSSAEPALPPAPTMLRAEVEMMRTEGKCWRVPLVSYMEDVGANGLKLVAALNKCERSRSAALMRSANFDLAVLKERYNVGILLREFALEVGAPPPSDIMSVLWCETRVELPCAPFMPMLQCLVPEGGDGAPVCSGRFVLLMLEVKSMGVLQDTRIYEQVATPLRQALGIAKPTGKEGVPKFPRCYPTRGRPFRPRQLLRADCTILPSDCDMYRVIFHPQVPNVCERMNFALGTEFREQPGVAIYANLAKPARVGDRYDAHVFVEPPEATSGQHRVLYLFSYQGQTGAAANVMAVFMVFGAAPGALTSEDVTACAAQRLAGLSAFAAGGATPKVDAEVDLSQCARAS